jgi:membrane-associated protein
MSKVIDLLKTLLADPDKLMTFIRDHGGLYVVMFIVFAETGLFIGFFLPGDSLLFVAGIIIATASPAPFANNAANIAYWITLISLAATVGNLLGYWLGNKSGHMWFEKKDTWLFKRKHLVQAHDFYEKKGGFAIVMGRFLPIVRTFAPLVAGIVDMNFKKFFTYSVVGAIAWVTSMMLAGYFLGTVDFVKKHLEMIVIGIIVVTTFPVLFKMIFGKKEEKPTPPNA